MAFGSVVCHFSFLNCSPVEGEELEMCPFAACTAGRDYVAGMAGAAMLVAALLVALVLLMGVRARL